MRRTILFLFFAACLHAKEPIKIVEILDTNLFMTDSGDTLSMAFIETVSIYAETKPEKSLADKTYNLLQKTFRLYKIYAEKDSMSTQVELYKKYPLGYESINLLLLQEGYATLTDEDQAPQSFVQAEITSERNRLGLHKIHYSSNDPIYQYAIWINSGIGWGGLVSYKGGAALVLNTQTGATFRYNRFAFDGGYTKISGSSESTYQMWYAGVGYAISKPHTEAILSISPSIYQYEYYYEFQQGEHLHSELKRDNLTPGLLLKSQLLVHFFRSVGLGMSFYANFAKKGAFCLFTVNAVLGGWF